MMPEAQMLGSNQQHPAPVLISSGGQLAHGQPSATKHQYKGRQGHPPTAFLLITQPRAGTARHGHQEMAMTGNRCAPESTVANQRQCGERVKGAPDAQERLARPFRTDR